MKIPAEVLPRNLGESNITAIDEEKGAKPVDGSAKLGDALKYSLLKERQVLKENIKRVELGQDHRRSRGLSSYQSALKNGDTERRKEERRKEKLPVLLDTRLSRCRRKSARNSAIDCKI